MFEVIVAYFNNNSFEKIISEIKTDKIPGLCILEFDFEFQLDDP